MLRLIIAAILALAGIGASPPPPKPPVCVRIEIVNSYTEHGVTHLLAPEISTACFDAW